MRTAIGIGAAGFLATVAIGLITADRYYARGKRDEAIKWEVERARIIAERDAKQQALDDLAAAQEQLTFENVRLFQALRLAQVETPTEIEYVEAPAPDCPVVVVDTGQLVREYGSFAAAYGGSSVPGARSVASAGTTSAGTSGGDDPDT
ncbi:MAG: hypothetical protein AAFR65_16590 [Pseudomonadota bacterium]